MTGPADETRIRRILDKPELSRLVDRLQTRFERGIDPTHVTLPDPELEERKAIAMLLGRPVSRGRSIRVAVADLEQVIQRAGLAPDLRTAVERLRGPLSDLRGEKSAAQQAWERAYKSIQATAAELGMHEWLDGLRKDGLLKRLAKGQPDTAQVLANQALEVIGQLPGEGQTLSTLAAITLGDAHALDGGRPVATLVKRAIARPETLTTEQDQDETDRELWARAGILVGGAITSTVLVLNLPVAGKGFSAQVVRQANHHGQPLWLTLRHLVRDPPHWPVAGRTIHICENPAVVAEAADRLGPECAPLVCTCGHPRAAVNHLLLQLSEAGAELVYHGDFDWPGIVIGNGIMRRFGAKPWCFDEAAYRRAAHKGAMMLTGRSVIAEWDPGLTQAMKEAKTAIPEERVLDMLWEALQ